VSVTAKSNSRRHTWLACILAPLGIAFLFRGRDAINFVLDLRLPACARPDALERRYAEQLSVLAKYAHENERSIVEANPDCVSAADRALFEGPEFMSAHVHKKVSPSDWRGFPLNDGNMVGRWGLFQRVPEDGHSIVNLWWGSGHRYAEYLAYERDPDGDLFRYEMVFDIAKLEALP
jgi:hypothetical protein